MRRRRHSRAFTDMQIDQEQAGVLGELAVAERFGFDPSPIVLSSGSGPVDFVLPDGSTLDIKASWLRDIPTKGKNQGGRLMVEKGHVNADVYAFAVCHPDAGDGYPVGDLVGWAAAAKIVATPATWEGRGINRMLSHRVPVEGLRAIADLDARVRFNIERAAKATAEHEALPVEQIDDFESGFRYGVRWSPNRSIADVYLNRVHLGIVYKVNDNNGKSWWFVFGDDKNTPYRTAQAAIKSMLDRALGHGKQAKLTDRQRSSPDYDRRQR